MGKYLALIIFLFSCSMENSSKIDQIFSDYDSPELPGAAVMIINNGKIIFNKGYGIAEFSKGIPITDSTNFRLASITKQFTAMSILQLIDKNYLSLNSTLKEIFPQFPDYGKNITIKHLLQHTSGLVDYEDLIPDSATIQIKDNDILNMMIKIDSIYFQPGEKHQYSNTGYALLSQIVERISGLSFRDYLKKMIFEPVGMSNTIAFENKINDVKNRAFGYTIENNQIKFTDQSITSAVLGDGGIYSSTKDLFMWDQALYTNLLLSERLFKEVFERGKLNNGEYFDYGYGWRLENYNHKEIVYHTGSTYGFRNIIYRIPEEKFTIIILTNRNSGSEFSTLDLAHKIVDLYF